MSHTRVNDVPASHPNAPTPRSGTFRLTVVALAFLGACLIAANAHHGWLT